MTRTIAICLQPDDAKVIHPLTWQYLYDNWINKGIGPQCMTFRREPDRESIAWRKLVEELEGHPLVVWGD